MKFNCIVHMFYLLLTTKEIALDQNGMKEKVEFQDEALQVMNKISLGESVIIYDNSIGMPILRRMAGRNAFKHEQRIFLQFSSSSFESNFKKIFNSRGNSALHMVLLLQFPEGINQFFKTLNKEINSTVLEEVFYWLIIDETFKSVCSEKKRLALGSENILNVISTSQGVLEFSFIFSEKKRTRCIGLKKGYSLQNIFPLLRTFKLQADVKEEDIKDPTFVIIKDTDPLKMSGIYPNILEILQEDLKTTFKFHIVGDGNFGLKLENGSWNGMVQELIEGKADIAIGPLSLTHDRAQVIDFSPPVLYSGYSLIYAKPEKFFNVSSYLSPFSMSIWILISATIFVYCLVVHTIGTLSYDFSNSDCRFELNYKMNFFSFLSIASTQGLYYEPNSSSTRMAIFVIFIWSIVINVAYTANIMTVLTMTKRNIPFESLYEFSEQKEYLPILLDNSGDIEFLKNSETNWHQKIYETALANKESSLVRSPIEGRRLIKEKKVAYFGDYLNILMNIQDPNINYVKQVEGKSGLYIAYRKNFKYKSLITQRLLKIQESGILSRIISKNIKSSKYDQHGTEEWFQFQLSNIYAPFLIFGFGIVTSLVIFGFEYFLVKPTKKS